MIPTAVRYTTGRWNSGANSRTESCRADRLGREADDRNSLRLTLHQRTAAHGMRATSPTSRALLWW